MARKRASGGGRRPRGEHFGNSEALSMRITPEIRASLEAARATAEKRAGRPRSLTQEAQSRLDWSFQVDAKRTRDKDRRHIHALTEAIELVIERIEGVTG